MGAFLAGLLMGESPFAVQIRADIAALRAVLVTLFFASIGMLGDPAWAIAHAHWVGGAVAATIVGKTCIVWALGRMLGLSHGTAIATGLCVAQIGEFSFVLAQMAARATGPGGPMIDDDTARLIITTTIATLFLTPFLVAAAPRVSGWVDACLRRRRGGPQAPGEAPAAPPPEQPQVLLIGFGPAGQSVAEALLRQLGPRLRVIDLNPRNAAIAERYGLPVQVGDATQLEMLEHAGAERCAVIIVTIPDPEAARTVVHQCRHLAPGATIIARARYHMHRWDLELAGAATVIDEERQVGLRLAADARRHLHAAAAPPRGDRAGPEAGA
jgi:CPA2 family monovalent cation:H+ antiporter-2